ncbi:MAG: extracellular solute-binding protein [Eubacteriales bacterium]|nr:extracellular solute-binding protein [Eubacteriales bacterium]
MKRTLSLLIALLLVIGLMPLPGALAENDEKVVIEFFYAPWASAPYAGDDPYEAYAEEKYGADFVLSPATDFDTQILMRAAADDMPDVMILTNTQLNRLLEQGVVLDDWTPYLESMPTINSYLTDTQKAFLTRDGKFVACPCIATSSPKAFMIRQDWLDKLGLSMPTNVAELIDVMRAFTFDDPDGNGIDDTWGFTCAGANKGTGNLRGFMNLFDRDGVNFYVDQDGKTNHPILDGSFLDYLKVCNTIISEGLIYPDWYTQGDEDQFVEIYNGKIGVVYYTPSNIIIKTDNARNYDGSVVGEWAYAPNFSGYESSMNSIGVLRTVSAKAAADPKKMEIICRYLNEGSYPNEDYFALRAGYKCDGYDILEKMDNGFWFLGKSSKENVTVRQQGSILFGWGQMVQAELPFYIQSQESSMTAVDKYRQDMIAAVYNAKHYPGTYQMINADATLTTDSDNCISEFEIAYILGNKKESDYDAFVSQWKSVAGDQLYAAAEEAFIQYGLTK